MDYRSVSAIGLGCILILASCRGGNSPDEAIRSVNRTNMQRLANLYMLYQVQHKFKGPRDEAEFRTFLSQADANALEKMGVSAQELDKLFLSERDGEPFQVKYGVPSSPRGSKAPVIFESKGQGGLRMVGFLNMVQREVDEAEFDSLWKMANSANAAGGNRVTGSAR